MDRSTDNKGQFLFEDDLSNIDPEIQRLVDLEDERQVRKIILIASESLSPRAVKQALNSSYTNLYAEGYPSTRMIKSKERPISDYEHHLSFFRRYYDRRYYKGCDYINIVEALCQQRAAELFATDRFDGPGPKVRADQIYANVQSLSGAAGNNAVYEAFVKPGDTVMGMSLDSGGHLTHGSPVNRSGKRYNICSYTVNRSTGKLDYEEIRKIALEHMPKMIIAGYSAYPWAIDWLAFRKIADELQNNCILLADISHPSGLVIAGAFPSPIGVADVTMTTTHKTLCGPRGALLLTTEKSKADAIDFAVFPGEQGGPHINNIVGKAVAFKMAMSDEFQKMQVKIRENALYLAERLKEKGFKLAYGGTESHLFLLDLKNLKGPYKFTLRGEVASRILDLCGITCNKNTIAGDTNAAHPSAIRIGATWITQRGFDKPELDKLADLIHKALTQAIPFHYIGPSNDLGRARIDFKVMEEIKAGVQELLESVEPKFPKDSPLYPHYSMPLAHKEVSSHFEVSGERAGNFLQDILTSNVRTMEENQCQNAFMLDSDGKLFASLAIQKLKTDSLGFDTFHLGVNGDNAKEVLAWMRGLSDGYVLFDREDIHRKPEGPVVIREVDLVSNELKGMMDKAIPMSSGDTTDASALYERQADAFDLTKPYFLGQGQAPKAEALKKYEYKSVEGPLKRTALYDEHKKLAKEYLVPFAGWEMPVWYTRVSEEHRAVRTTAGLFDVAHMGVFDVRGPYAARFLDAITTNYVVRMAIGQAQYNYLLYPDGTVVDDIMIYKLGEENFQVVCNAANEDKVLDWVHAVNSGEVMIDPDNPGVRIENKAQIRSLKDPSSGEDMRIDIALQGPNSCKILKAMTDDPEVKHELEMLPKSMLIRTELAGIPVIVSRTGYTGEEFGYELFVHPDRAVEFWKAAMEMGEPYGIVATGLGSRDSTRTEAGFPLYGHELAGDYDVDPIEASYGSFIKFHKPFFIGRSAMLKRWLKPRKKAVCRFRVTTKNPRNIRPGDIVVDRSGRYIGNVTSCALIENKLKGLALVDANFASSGKKIAIFPLPPGKKLPPAVAWDNVKKGDKLIVSERAIVLPRFPMRS